MKKFKKAAALGLSLAMVMSMAACGTSASSTASVAEAAGSEAAASTAENATGNTSGSAIKLGWHWPPDRRCLLFMAMQPSTAPSWL